MLRVFYLTLFCLLASVQLCLANVSLFADPVDGSNSLRFERVPVAALGNKKEIHIRVSSTSGERYQIFQRILEPIVNQKGDALNLQAIITQTFPNSNSAGTLYLQNSDHLTLGDQLIYSSSQTGSSDSFLIGYVLNQNLINASGSFRGRIIFTVRGMGNADSDQIALDVFLDATSSLQVTVKGGHNPNRIHVRGTDTSDNTADYVNFTFSGNAGGEVRIYQETDNLPQNESDNSLGSNVLELDSQGTDGLRLEGLSPLVTNRTLIYSSSKTEDNFNLYFLVDSGQVQQQEAGTYRGRINYIVETTQGQQTFPIDLQIDIPPVFTMTVTPPPGGVAYSHVLADNPPQEKQVVITVYSNLHQPYQVLQNIQTSMTNQEGKEFNNKYFNILVEIPKDQRGQTNFAEFTPVQTGEYPIFSSDSRGSAATITVMYRLQGYPQMSPGDFTEPIVYSLNQK